MTYLPAQVTGRWFHLYLILDLYSCKIVGREVHDSDHADHAVHLVRRTALAEGIAALAARPVLHGDNGFITVCSKRSRFSSGIARRFSRKFLKHMEIPFN